jgi:hypothetical protein
VGIKGLEINVVIVGVHSQTLFLKSNRLWVCYWIFLTKCCQVLLHQFNKKILLFSKITLIIRIFTISLLFCCLHRFSSQLLITQRHTCFIISAIWQDCFFQGGMDFMKSYSSLTVHTNSGHYSAPLLQGWGIRGKS